ncbi:nucleotidyltransferase domain-containing protein [Patescibacteria group bacterium]|nr:nucleotidyltransferase domain-containing protein [Patescibacteria group bacterium]
MTKKILSELKKNTAAIFDKYGIKRAGVFGSFARGETGESSDIDFYVIYGPETTLFDIGGLSYELEEKLKTRVDLADGQCLKKELKPYILKDLEIFYEKR